MIAAPLPHRLLEFFTLREVEREVRALPEEARSSLARELTLASQKRDAAETLWPRGSMAEALRLARASLEIAASSLASFASSVTPPPGWLAGAQATVTDALARTADARFPELETDARPEDEETFRLIIEALLSIEQKAGLLLAPPREIARVRRRRWTTTAVTGGLAVLLLAWLLKVPTVAHVTASGQLGNNPDAADALIDGDPKTPWYLPDRQLGWVDLTLGRAQKVHALRIATGNPPWNDREAKDVLVETFLKGALVKGVDATLVEPPLDDVGWTNVVVDSPKCDHVRITVKSYYKLGAGIAEIEVK